MTTTASESALRHQPLAPFDGGRSGTGLKGLERYSADSLDQTQSSASLDPISGRHQRHCLQSQHQAASSLRRISPPPPSSSTGVSTATGATSRISWDPFAPNGDQGKGKPSLLAASRNRYRSFTKHAPSENNAPSSHTRSQSLSAPLPLPSLLLDEKPQQPNSNILLSPIPTHTSRYSSPRKSSSTRSAVLPPASHCSDESTRPSQRSDTHPDPSPSRVRLRSFRNRLTGSLGPPGLGSVKPFRNLPGTPGVSGTANEPRVSPSPQPVVAKMVGGAREAALGTALREGADPVETLEEYAWRSLVARVRVREYCEGATFAVCASSVHHVRTAITHTPTRLLFPYDFTADAPSGAHTPPLSTPSILNALTRRQVVDALVRLARERTSVESRVLEVMLEYIGKKWHASEGDVECVAKKLSEIMSDIEASEPDKSSTVLSTIQRLRFQLGLVSASQLTTRLNSLPAFLRDHNALNAQELVQAWAVRRLNASQLPQIVAVELHGLRESLTHAPHRDAVGSVLRSFGLDGRRLSGKESPPRTRNRVTSRSFQTSPRITPPKRRTMPFPHWLPRNSTRLNASEERRPSLPTLLAPAEPTQISWPIPLQGQDGPLRASPNGSPCHTPPPATNGTNGGNGQLGNLDPADVRVAVVDQILELRYRLGPDADGWFLGTGQDKAADIVNHFPGSDELRDVLAELRRIFQLTDPNVNNKLGLTFQSPQVRVEPLEGSKIGVNVTTPTLETFDVIHERDVSFDLDQYMADISVDDLDASSSTIRPDDDDQATKTEVLVTDEDDSGTATESLGLRTGRVIPGEEIESPKLLTSYHAPEETRSSVSSEVSQFSFTSSSALSSDGRRRSTISDFVICEAVRVAVDQRAAVEEVPHQLPTKGATDKPFPRHSKSLSVLSDPDLYTRVPEMRARRSPQRQTKTLPSLSAPLNATGFDAGPVNEEVPPVPCLPRLISPTPNPSPLEVDFSISPAIPPVTSPIATARPSMDSQSIVEGPPSPSTDTSSSESAGSYQRLSASPIERAASRTPTVSSTEDRSRRHRQMVIVDGEPISPGSSKTPLGMVLTLFSQREHLTPTTVEDILGHAVQIEKERMAAQDEEFDAEARVRLAWLLEQVANELSQPDLIDAVQRVLTRLSNKEIPVRKPSSTASYSPKSTSSAKSSPSVEGEAFPTHRRYGPALAPTSPGYQLRSQATPPSSFAPRMYGRRDLTITVPPRNRSSIQVTSSPPSSPSTVVATNYPLTSPDMTSDSSESVYSSGSLDSASMSTAASFGMTPSTDESFSTSPVSARRPAAGKPPLVRFPNYHLAMATNAVLQRQRTAPGYSATPHKGQRLSVGASPSAPLTPLTPEQAALSFDSPESAKGIGRSHFPPQPPNISPPVPLTDIHAL